jgi:prevent-host-death family protein
MASTVGIREARIHFSLLMKKVRKGMEIVITDRGKPVGKIVPFHRPSLSLAERIHDLEARGIIEERKSPSSPLAPPIPVEGEGDIAQEFLQEHRS